MCFGLLLENQTSSYDTEFIQRIFFIEQRILFSQTVKISMGKPLLSSLKSPWTLHPPDKVKKFINLPLRPCQCETDSLSLRKIHNLRWRSRKKASIRKVKEIAISRENKVKRKSPSQRGREMAPSLSLFPSRGFRCWCHFATEPYIYSFPPPKGEKAV